MCYEITSNDLLCHMIIQWQWSILHIHITYTWCGKVTDMKDISWWFVLLTKHDIKHYELTWLCPNMGVVRSMAMSQATWGTIICLQDIGLSTMLCCNYYPAVTICPCLPVQGCRLKVSSVSCSKTRFAWTLSVALIPSVWLSFTYLYIRAGRTTGLGVVRYRTSAPIFFHFVSYRTFATLLNFFFFI